MLPIEDKYDRSTCLRQSCYYGKGVNKCDNKRKCYSDIVGVRNFPFCGLTLINISHDLQNSLGL